ncbi:MAG: glycoside hydrolase domain-containing protein [Candidatus Hodarchaeota archaeon]
MPNEQAKNHAQEISIKPLSIDQDTATGTKKGIAKSQLVHVLQWLSFPLSIFGLVGWVLMFFDAFPLAENFEGRALTAGLGESVYALLLFLLIILLVVLFWKNKGARAFSSILAMITGLFCYVALQLFEHSSTDPNAAGKIIIGLFVHTFPNGLPFTLLGMGLIVLVATEFVHVLDRTMIHGRSGIGQVIIASCISLIVSVFHEWMLQYNVLMLACVIAPLVTFVMVVLAPAGGILKSKAAPRGRRKLSTGIITFMFVLLISFASTYTGTATFFYLVMDIAIAWVSLGVLITTCSVELFSLLFPRNKIKLSWKPVFLAAIVMFIIQVLVLLEVFSFADSDKETNPPFPFSAMLCGMVLGLFVGAMLRVRPAFETFYKNAARTRPRNTHAAGHNVLVYGLIGGTFLGLMEGANDMSNSSGMEDMLLLGKEYGIVVLVVIACILILDSVIATRIKGIARTEKGQNGRVTRKAGTRGGLAMRFLSPKHSKIIAACIAIGVAATLAVPPLAILVTRSLAADPNPTTRVVLQQGDCTFAEVSPLVRLGRYAPLFDNGRTNDANSENGILHLSLAKNEFEPVQLAIRNDGVVPITITNASIANSSHGGLPAAFARPDVVKSWKSESWYWPRFLAQHVADIQPGIPNVLYEINGNQTRVELAPGDPGPRPAPVVNPGEVLSLWFTMYAGTDIPAGQYSDTISIESTAWTVDFTLLTTVWNFTVPDEPGTHGMRVALGNKRLYYLDTRDEFTKVYLQHRISPYRPYFRTNPLFYTTNNSFNETDLSAYLSDIGNAIDNGLDAFRLEYHPGAFTFTSEFNASTIAYYSRLGNELGNRTVGSTNKTWLDLAILYAIDEPDEDEYVQFNSWSTLVHAAHPGWKVLLTEQVEPELEGFVDIWCPHINRVDLSNIPTQHTAGTEFWYYTCCGVVNRPTISFVEPPTAHQALFWSAYAMDFDGYLFYDAQGFVGYDDYDTYRIGDTGLGSAMMILSDGNDMPVNTIVWESLRDGIEMNEYFRMLET